MSDKSTMHGGGESYSGVVPAKQPNKSGKPQAEVVEERPLAKENTEQSNQCRTQSRESGSNGLGRVREVAKKDGKVSNIRIRQSASTPNIQGRNRVRESRQHGTVRGVSGNRHPYRDQRRDSSRRFFTLALSRIISACENDI
jgi:hypothetical protein